MLAKSKKFLLEGRYTDDLPYDSFTECVQFCNMLEKIRLEKDL